MAQIWDIKNVVIKGDKWRWNVCKFK